MRCARSVGRLAAEAGLEVQQIQLGEVILAADCAIGRFSEGA